MSGKAVDAHLGHGDFEGSCGTYAGVLCDDGDMCTQDRFYAGTETCEANIEVDTDDANSCTADSCDSAIGSVTAPLADGTACDDGGGARSCVADVCITLDDGASGDLTVTTSNGGPHRFLEFDTAAGTVSWQADANTFEAAVNLFTVSGNQATIFGTVTTASATSGAATGDSFSFDVADGTPDAVYWAWLTGPNFTGSFTVVGGDLTVSDAP